MALAGRKYTTGDGNLGPALDVSTSTKAAAQARRGGNRMLLLLGGARASGSPWSAVLAAVAYVLHAADSAPALDTPASDRVSGGSSQVFAADGTRLGFIQSDELRTPVGLA